MNNLVNNCGENIEYQYPPIFGCCLFHVGKGRIIFLNFGYVLQSLTIGSAEHSSRPSGAKGIEKSVPDELGWLCMTRQRHNEPSSTGERQCKSETATVAEVGGCRPFCMRLQGAQTGAPTHRQPRNTPHTPQNHNGTTTNSLID